MSGSVSAMSMRGAEPAVERFFGEWGEVGESQWNQADPTTLPQTGTFDETITELTGKTEYEFRAHAEGGEGSDAGDTLTFTTPEPAVSARIEIDGTYSLPTRRIDEDSEALVKLRA